MNGVSEGVSMQACELEYEINENFIGPALTDEALIAEAKSGDHLAFGQLWKRHSNTAFKIVYRIAGNRDDAEDAIQDAWMKAYIHLHTFDGRSKFSTWFTRIAINSALMILRKKRTHPETSMEWSVDGETWQQWEVPDKRANTERALCEKGTRKGITASDKPFTPRPPYCHRNSAIK